MTLKGWNGTELIQGGPLPEYDPSAEQANLR